MTLRKNTRVQVYVLGYSGNPIVQGTVLADQPRALPDGDGAETMYALVRLDTDHPNSGGTWWPHSWLAEVP